MRIILIRHTAYYATANLVTFILASSLLLLMLIFMIISPGMLETEAFRSSTMSPLLLFKGPAFEENNNCNQINKENFLLVSSSNRRQKRRRTAGVTTITEMEPRRSSNGGGSSSSSSSSNATLGSGSKSATTLPRITRKAPGAPVVDSTLLRFISQQKEIQDVFAVSDVDMDAVVADRNKNNEQNNNNKKSSSNEENNNKVLYEKKMLATSELAKKIRKVSSATPSNGVVKPPTQRIATVTNSKLSMRKQIQDITKNRNNGESLNNINGSNTDPPSVDEEKNQQANEEDEWVVANTIANTDPSSSSTASSQKQSWMAQFSSKNIQHVLLTSANATNDNSISDPNVAKLAGDAVERYCTVRTARRRIRRFLKERDNLWSYGVNGDDDSSSNSASSRAELETLAAFEAASSPAASLLLSYAEQQQQRKQRMQGIEEDEDEEEDDDIDVEDPEYNFQDAIDVMKGYGLTSNDVCVLLTRSPNLALRVPTKSLMMARRNKEDEDSASTKINHAESLEETLERSFQQLLQGTLGLRRYDARKVLRQCPNLMSVRGSKSAVHIISMMKTTGVSSSSLARDKNGLPTLLSRSPASLFRLVSFLSSTYVRMPMNQIGPLLRRKVGRNLLDAVNPVPAEATTTVNTAAAPAPAVPEGVNGALHTTEEVPQTSREMFNRNRAERKAEIERTYKRMVRTADILQRQIGTKDLTKVVSAYPEVLLLDAEKEILPVARYLMGGLGIWNEDLSSLLQLYPTVMGKGILELEKVVSYLVDVGVDENDLGKIFRAFPMIFNLDVESDIEPVVRYLKSTCGVKDVGKFVTRLPAVVGYDLEKDIRPKWEFLKKITLQPEYELSKFPAYLSYPFHRVIKTRFNYLAHKNIFWCFSSIDQVLRHGDVEFATKIAVDNDKGESYKAFGLQHSVGSKDLITKPWRPTKRRRRNKKYNARNRQPIQSQVQQEQGQGQSQSPRQQRQQRKKKKKVNNTPDDVIRNLNAVFKKTLRNENSSMKKNTIDSKTTTTAIVSPVEKKNYKQQEQQQQKQQRRRQQQDEDDGLNIGSLTPTPA